MTAISLRPSPGRGALDLVDALSSAAWGPLAGADWRASRVLLETLARLMWKSKADRRGELTITAIQLADKTGYCDRWVRTHLNILEEVGAIRWERGGIKDGKPRPGFIRIVKSTLCGWIEVARQAHDETLKVRAAEFTARLRTLKYLTIFPKFRRRPLAAVAAPLPPYGGVRAGKKTRRPTITTQKENNPMRQPSKEFIPARCHHGDGSNSPLHCDLCLYNARRAEQRTIKAPTIPAYGQSRLDLPSVPADPAEPDKETLMVLEYMAAAHPDLRPGGPFALAYKHDHEAGKVDQWQKINA